MREIKFRAWDNVDYMSNPFTIYDVQLSRISMTKDAIILQYTGYKDKHLVEIYEKDIVQRYNKLYVVHFGHSSARFCLFDAIGDSYDITHGDRDCYEVIGNIYENPELLEHTGQKNEAKPLL